MIAAAIAATSLAAPLEVEVPVYVEDKGYFNGLKEGIFLPIEEHALKVTNCNRPHQPHIVQNYYIQ